MLTTRDFNTDCIFSLKISLLEKKEEARIKHCGIYSVLKIFFLRNVQKYIFLYF